MDIFLFLVSKMTSELDPPKITCDSVLKDDRLSGNCTAVIDPNRHASPMEFTDFRPFMKTHLLFPAFFVCLTGATVFAQEDDPDRPVAQVPAHTPAETAAMMMVPDGFQVELIAGEPDIVQPIAYTFDERGRIWVLENTNYPISPGEPRERILVLEDADGDGTFEKRTVFLENLNFGSGLAVGFGGVWVGSPPNLLFIPDRDGDAVPDGPPEITLDGWGAQDTHETMNNFIWGPDGWLYGTQGIFTESRVGKPGTEKAARVAINAGVWRYHPKRQVFERWCEGVSNQWGIDWNDHGDAFFAACVIPHMWHGIEGAHYTRQGGSHFNPHVYEDIQTIAWGRYEKAAYCGAMIYLGGAFPAEWRDTFFFHDIHMNKLRCESMVPAGSGFRSERKADFMESPDPWFRGLSPQYGPDGGVFISDWYDKVPCHQQKEFTDRSNGRLYKIVNDAVKPRQVDLSKATNAELVKLQLDPNDWYVRHARRLLQERGATPETTAALEKILFENPDDTRQLRALWALHSQQALSEATAIRALSAASPAVRGWTITCVTELGNPPAEVFAKLVEMAANDPAASVRLRLASAAQKLAPASRWPLVTALAAHAEDIGDQNLPLMIWYAVESAVAVTPEKGVALLAETPQPRLHTFISRRILSGFIENPGSVDGIDALVEHLGNTDSATRDRMLTGMLAAAIGQQELPEPSHWPTTYAALRTDELPAVREKSRTLALIFGSAAALEELRGLLGDATAPTEIRLSALQSLAARHDPASLDVFLSLAHASGPLRSPALQSLAGYDDPRISPQIIADYSSMESSEKSAALNTLVARIKNAKTLLNGIDAGSISRNDLTAPLARLIHGFGDESMNSWLEKNFGAVRSTNAERQAEIVRYRKFLGDDAISRADVQKGREHFQRACSACHSMFGNGGHIGPELPGNFADTEYLLQNILDPNSVIGRDFQQTFITTKSGNVVAGVVTAEDSKTVTLKTLGAPVTVARDDIEKQELSPFSMMPEGLLNGLEEPEVRDLFLYLRQSSDPSEAGKP